MIEFIKKAVSDIVDKEFRLDIEKSIIEHSDRVNFRCPYCHEGRTKSKKRGNIYFNTLFFICFRCGKKTFFDSFCKDFNKPIDPDTKIEMINHLDAAMVSYNEHRNDYIDTNLDDLINLNELSDALNTNKYNISEFNPIVYGGGVYKYLLGRGIHEDIHTNIYQAKYWRTEYEYEWVIVMLNKKENKILGMQLRNLKMGKRRFFKIYNYENLLQIVNDYKNIETDISINKLVFYNKISYYYNILNINPMNMITIFEGYLDSLFAPNAIGLVGINTNSELLENNDMDIRFLYDNDFIGNKKSLEKMRMGYSIFLWNKLFKELVDKKRPPNPEQYLYRISKIKDLNKLSELVSNSWNVLGLDKYFSDDVMDCIWITKNQPSYIKTVDYDKKFKEFDKNF